MIMQGLMVDKAEMEKMVKEMVDQRPAEEPKAVVELKEVVEVKEVVELKEVEHQREVVKALLVNHIKNIFVL